MKRINSVLFVLILTLSGCAAQKAATVNQVTTITIADAGALANQAKAAYLAGTIPQNSTTNKAINALGAAYNESKKDYEAVLEAEVAYKSTLAAQEAACGAPTSATASAPPTSGCTAAQEKAAKQAAAVAAAQSAFNSALVNMNSSIANVKTILGK